MGRVWIALPLVAAALTPSGCAVADPYGRSDRAPSRNPPNVRARVAPAPISIARRGAAAVARAFALAWTNWDWRTIDEAYGDRARLATGNLRRTLSQGRAAARRDLTLARDRLENRGRVVLAGVAERTGRAELRVVIVVRESNFAAGREALVSRAVRVYRATVVRTAGRWLVRGWELLA